MSTSIQDIYLTSEARYTVDFASIPETEEGRIRPLAAGGMDIKIKFWGRNNALPQEREAILQANSIAPQMIASKREITLGQGLELVKVIYEDGKKKFEPVAWPAQIQEWFDRVEIWDNYLEPAANDFYKHAMSFPELVRSKDRKSIASIKVLEACDIRAQEQDKQGFIPNYVYSKYWTSRRSKEASFTRIPNYLGEDKAQLKFIYPLADKLFFNGYYSSPAYWGGKTWIKTANIIPVFHESNMNHGYSIRFHIQIPRNYFQDKTAIAAAQAKGGDDLKAYENAEKSRRDEFINKINKWLSGALNAGRAIFTFYDFNQAFQKQFPGVIITPIKVDLKDEALLKLYDKTNEALISAQGLSPIVAGIQTQGKLASGAEIRNAFNSFILFKAPLPRRQILKPINLIARVNGWDKLIKHPYEIRFEDKHISKLDDDKSGVTLTMASDGK